MKSKFLFFVLTVMLLPQFGYAQGSCQPPTNLTGYSTPNAVELSWEAPQMSGSLNGTVLVQDTFDTYTVGAYVAQQAVAAGFTHWMPSNGITGYPLDATVSTDYSLSGTQSMKCSSGSDMMLNLGNKTTGHYLIDYYVYIPAGQYAEMHLYHVFNGNSDFQLGADIYLKNTSYGTMLMVAQAQYPFTMNYNEWTKFRFDIDIDQNTASMYVGESTTAVHSWTFTSQSMLTSPGTKKLAAFEFKSSSNATYYVDDVSVVEYALYYNLYRNSQILVADYQGINYTDANVVAGQQYSYYLTTKCGSSSESVPSDAFNISHGSSVLVDILVGEGTATSYTTPFDNYYKNSWIEMVYDASEIGVSGLIRALSFDCAVGGVLTFDNMKVYLAHKTTANYASTSSWTPMDDLTLVYDQNNVSLPTTAGWFELMLQTPFTYNGTDNLVVVVSKTAPAYSSAITWRYTSSSNSALYRHSDSDASYANHPGSNTGSLSANRPNALFTMSLSEGSCIRPGLLTLSNISANGISVAWEADGNTQWNLKYGAKNFAPETEGTLVSGLSAPNYTITSLAPNTEYDIYVQTVCSSGTPTAWRKASFATQCSATAIPLNESFENCTSLTSGSTNNLPDCWDYVNLGTSTSYIGYPNVYNSSTSAYSGTKSLRFYTYNSVAYGSQYAILPPVDTLQNLELSFMARQYSTSSDFQLQVGTIEGTNINTFVPLMTVSPESTTYESFSYAFAGVSGSGRRVALCAAQPTSAIYNGGSVDDISLHYLPSCPRPQDLTANNITETSIQLDWAEIGTATTWNIKLEDKNGDSLITYSNVTSKPFTINGLTTSTAYFVYVQSVNANEISDWSMALPFRTSCPLYLSLPYTNNFDDEESVTSVSANNLPACWDYYNTGTVSSYMYYPIIYSTTATAYLPYSGANAMRFYAYTTANAYSDQYAVLPPVSNVSALELTFFAKETSTVSTYISTIVVGVADDTTDPVSFVGVDTIILDGINYQQQFVNFSSYTGSGNRIAIMGKQPYTGYCSFMVDDIDLHLIPSCPMPQDLTVDSIAENFAILNWSEMGTATKWNIKYVQSGNTDTIFVNNNTIKPYQVNGLIGNTLYDFAVQAVKTNETSDWSPLYNFRTSCPQFQNIPYLEDFESWQGTTSANVNNLPSCWSYINEGSTNSGYPIIYSSSTSAYAASMNCMRFYNYSSTAYADQYAILPAVDSVQLLELSFMANRYSSYTFNIQVGVMTNEDVSTFTVVETFNKSTNNYEEFLVDFSQYTGTGNRIAIKAPHPSSSYNAGCIDNIDLHYLPYYQKPQDVTLTMLTPSGVTVGWTEVNTGVSLWEINLTSLNFDTTYIIQNNPYVISGLPSATDFEVAVRSIDTLGNTSVWSMPQNFTTLCETASTVVPYIENFDSYPSNTTGVVNNLPNCWSYINTSTNVSYAGYPIIYTSTSSAYSGDNFLRFYTYTSSSTSTYGNQYAIMPPVDTVQKFELSFMVKKYSTYTTNLEVGVMTDVMDETTFAMIQTIEPGANYEEYTIDLSTYQGSGKSIALRVMAPASSYSGCMVDDINLHFQPKVKKPIDLMAKNVNQNSAELHWVCLDSTAVSYNVHLTRGNMLDTTFVNVTTIPLLVNNLDPASEYNFTVQAFNALGENSVVSNSMMFTTWCQTTSTPLPLICDFENVTGVTLGTENNLPECWDYYNNSENASYIGYPIIYSSTASAYSGTNSLRFYSYQTTTSHYGDQYAVLPPMDSIQYLRISGKARKYSASYPFNFEVGVMTDASDISTFETISSIAINGAVYEDFEAAFSSYTGTGRIAIRLLKPETSYNAGNIDDLMVVRIPDCPRPSDLRVDLIGSTSMTLAWTPDVLSNPLSYLVLYKQISASSFDTLTTTTNSVEINGLLPNSDYEWKVAAQCNANEIGEWSVQKVFTTACANAVLPITENFDNETGTTLTNAANNLPSCWNYFNGAVGTTYTGYPIVYNASSSAYSGANFLRFYMYYSTAYADQYAILPPVDSINGVQLVCQARETSTTSTYVGNIAVGVMTIPSDTSTFVAIDTIAPTTATYEEYTVYFNNYTGNGRYIALKGIKPTTGYNCVNIDDVTIDYIPACPPVSDITLINNTENEISLTWTENGTSPSWDIQYDTMGFVLGTGNIVNVTNDTAVLQNLVSSTTYDFYVRAHCSNLNISQWVGPLTAQTLVACAEGYNAFAGSIGSGSNMLYTMPINTYYKYSYVQQIFTSTELSAMGLVMGDIHTIAYQYAYNVPQETKNLKISIGVTSQSNMTSAWVPDSLLTVVFDGEVNFDSDHANYWNDIQLQNAFNYNGTGNLVIAILNYTGTYTTSSSPTFMTHATDIAMTRTYQIDSSPINMLALPVGSPVTSRNNIKLYACMPDNICVPPLAIAADEVTDNSALISWTISGAPDQVEIEYGINGFEPGNGTVLLLPDTVNTLLISNLSPNTSYDVYGRSYCGVGDTSVRSMGAFRTACGQTTGLPYAENFDMWPGTTASTGANNLPDCWNYINTGTTYPNHPAIYSTSASAYSGSNILRFYTYYSTSYADQYAIMSPMDNISTLALSGFARESSSTSTYVGNIAVGVMSNPSDASTFVQIASLQPTTTTYVPFTILFTNAPDSCRYIALKAVQPTSGYNIVYMDDILVESLGECPFVTDIEGTSVDGSTTVTWSENGQATQWQLEYGLQDYEQGQGTLLTVNGTPSCTLTNLDGNSLYDVYVRPMCSDSLFGTWKKGTFRTACPQYQPIPYAENFDSWDGTTSGSVNNLPACWDYYNQSTSTSYMGYPIIYTSTSYSYSGANSMRFYSYYSTGEDEYAILPAVDNVSALQLSFYARMQSTSTTYVSELKIGVMTDKDDVSTFQEISSITPNLVSYQQYVFYLSQYTGNGHYVALKAPKPTTGYNYVYVDDLLLDSMPECPPASNLQVSATTNTALLSWFENGDATSWNVEYGAKDFTLGTGTTVVSNYDTLTITGLTNDYPYDFYVQPSCGGDWAGPKTFYMAQTPATLPYNCGFEAADPESNKWILENGDEASQWFVGADYYHYSSYSGNQGLYISMDDGLTNYYSSTVASAVYAYRTFDLESVPYTFSFKWICNGQTNYDYLRAFLVPAGNVPEAGNNNGITATTSPNGWIALDDNVALNQVMDWQTLTKEVTPQTAGYYNLVFFWVNNASTAGFPAPAIDDIQVFSMTCDVPSDLALITSDNASATLTWNENGDATSWNVEYGSQGFTVGNGTQIVATNDTLTITGLSANTQYDVYVQSVCGIDDVSGWFGPLTFATAICPATDMCPITLELNCQTIDGWNNAYITLNNEGLFVNNYTIDFGSNNAVFNVNLCPGTLDFTWHSGLFDNEVSFVIKNADGEVIYSCESGVLLSENQQFLTYEHSCGNLLCPKPTNLEAEVDNFVISLSWIASDSATSYKVYRDDVLMTTVTTTSYTEIATQNGIFTYYVTAVCPNTEEESNASNAVSVTIQGIGLAENAAEYAQVYPNPTDGKLYIEALGMKRITVLNLMGQSLFDVEIANDEYEFDFAGMHNGVYLLRIETETGTATKRVVLVK